MNKKLRRTCKVVVLLMFLAKHEKVMSRGRACSMEKQTVARSGFSSFVAQCPAWRNHCWQYKAVPILNDCARKMLKTCSLECQKVL